MKKIAILLIALMVISVGFLSGCIQTNQNENGKEESEDTSDNDFWDDDDEDENDFWDDWDTETIMISGIDTVQTVHHLDKPVELMVSGIRNDVTVTKETNLVDIMLSGVDCIVRVSKSHSFDSLISGVGSEIVYYD